MDNLKKRQIMEEGRHHFIYGHNGEKRRIFLASLEDTYPIKVESSSPMAIYMGSLFLPRLNTKKPLRPEIDSLAREHTNFFIAERIIENVKRDAMQDIINSKIEELLKIVNRLFLNHGKQNISSLDELLTALRTSKKFYERYYVKSQRGEDTPSIDDLQLCFMQIVPFVHYVKNMLATKAPFSIIVDHQEPMNILSCQAINNLTGMRINDDISMNVAEQPEEWESFLAQNGTMIEAVHDYGVIELDDSLKTFIEEYKKKI